MIARLVAMTMVAAPPATQNSPPCYDSGEMADMAIVALPYVQEAAVDRCARLLPPEAFLLAERGRVQRQQLREAGRSRRASVLAALRRVRAYDFQRGATDDEKLENVLAAFAAGTVESMTLVRCDAMNTLMEALSPLPPDSVGRAFASLYGLAVAPPTSVLCPP